MKTKFSFSKKPHTSLLLATATLLLLSMQSATFAGSGTWLLNPATGVWNTGTNWSSATVPNGASDVATFDVSNTTGVSISSGVTVSGITFNSGASAFTITVNPGTVNLLTISGTGITNNSGITQNFVSGINQGTIRFTNSATAGSMTSFTNNGSTVSGQSGGVTRFVNTSNAGSAMITSNGGTISGAFGGITEFFDSSDAGSATLIANGGTGSGGGEIRFRDNSLGGTSTVKVFGNGSLDISLHNPPGLTIGSLEGSGSVRLGANNLTAGANSASTTFSGVMQDGGFGGGTGGSLTKTGTGTLTLTGANTYTGATTISGGTLQLGNGGTTGTLSTSSTITNNANFTINRSNAVVQGLDFSGSAITGTGSLTQAGTGTTTLTAANSYTGATTVNAGTLLINGNQPTATGAVTVNNSGTTLGGTGTIGGAVTVNSGANLSPGNSPGILNTGSVTLNSGSNLLIDINGPTVGTQYDQLNVTGTVTLNGGNLVLTIGGTLTVGEQFIIINNDLSDAVVGMFAQGTSVSSGGNTFSIDYAGGTNNNDVVLTVTTAAPEPSTWLGGALVFAGLAYTQRRRFARLLRKA